MPLDETTASGLRTIAERLGREIVDALQSRAVEIAARSDRLDIELYWRLWDAVYDLERQKRAEWIQQQLADDLEEERFREKLGDDYDAWIDQQTAEVTELMKSWLRRRGLSTK
ncbi:MAG: hypothetical protein WD557_14645 [Dehalococcoidia bacterium]